MNILNLIKNMTFFLATTVSDFGYRHLCGGNVRVYWTESTLLHSGEIITMICLSEAEVEKRSACYGLLQ